MQGEPLATTPAERRMLSNAIGSWDGKSKFEGLRQPWRNHYHGGVDDERVLSLVERGLFERVDAEHCRVSALGFEALDLPQPEARKLKPSRAIRVRRSRSAVGRENG